MPSLVSGTSMAALVTLPGVTTNPVDRVGGVCVVCGHHALEISHRTHDESVVRGDHRNQQVGVQFVWHCKVIFVFLIKSYEMPKIANISSSFILHLILSKKVSKFNTFNINYLSAIWIRLLFGRIWCGGYKNKPWLVNAAVLRRPCLVFASTADDLTSENARVQAKISLHIFRQCLSLLLPWSEVRF